MTPLGDPHNFGRRVSLSGDSRWVMKPRCLFWEWLLLSIESPLRLKLTELHFDSLLSRLPSLQFKDVSGHFADGQVEYLDLATVDSIDFTESAARDCGEASAFYTWLGLGDLHAWNMAFGRAKNGTILWAPLDIEIALDHYYLPFQSHLTPSNFVREGHEGFSSFKKLLSKASKHDRNLIPAFASGFFDGLTKFWKHEREILRSFESFVPKVPIRVILRATQDYMRCIADRSCWNDFDLMPEEIEQLKRGDIPYFFRYLESRQIFYFTSEDGSTSEVVPNVLTEKALDNTGGLERVAWNLEQRDLRAKAATLQLIKYFTSGFTDFKETFEKTSVCVTAQHIRFEHRSSDALMEVKIQCER